jgi:hypothetical protein
MKYNGLGNPTTVQNPYVFLIYKQDGHIQLTDSLRSDLTLKPLETLKLNSHFNGTWSYFYPQKEKKNAWLQMHGSSAKNLYICNQCLVHT